MLFFIDAYNLLFRLRIPLENFQTQRELLIWELNEKNRRVGLDIIVVFDAQYQLSEESRSHFGTLEVIYTSQNETADEYILHAVKYSKIPKNICVVTSDKILANKAKLKGAQILSLNKFISLLQSRSKNKKENPEKKISSPALFQKSPSQTRISFEENQQPSPQEIVNPGDFAYYLEHFEKEYQEIQEKERKRRDSQSNLKKKVHYGKKRKKPFGSEESEEEKTFCEITRWQKIFEGRLFKGDSNT